MTFKITAKERDLLLARREATGKKAKKGDPAVEGLKKSIMKQKAKIKKAREAYKAKMAPMKAELGKMREQLKKTREKAKNK